MLNRKQIPSPGGGLWHNNAVHRLLIDEFHLGWIIYGKVAGRHDKEMGGGQTIKPRTEWILSAEVSHTPLKTQEEHDQIIFLLNENKRRPSASRNGKYPLSGLMYCEKCGHRMRFYKRTSRRSGETYDNVKCDYYGPLGKTCNQMGAKLTDDFYQLVLDEIRTQYINQERLIKLGKEEQALAHKVLELSIAKDELLKKKDAKRRAEALYLEGIEDAEFYKQYKAKYEQEMVILESIIRTLERQTNTVIPTEKELRAKGEVFFKKWASATTSAEKNKLFASIIKCVWYDRDSETGEISVSIEYL